MSIFKTGFGVDLSSLHRGVVAFFRTPHKKLKMDYGGENRCFNGLMVCVKYKKQADSQQRPMEPEWLIRKYKPLHDLMAFCSKCIL